MLSTVPVLNTFFTATPSRSNSMADPPLMRSQSLPGTLRSHSMSDYPIRMSTISEGYVPPTVPAAAATASTSTSSLSTHGTGGVTSSDSSSTPKEKPITNTSRSVSFESTEGKSKSVDGADKLSPVNNNSSNSSGNTSRKNNADKIAARLEAIRKK